MVFVLFMRGARLRARMVLMGARSFRAVHMTATLLAQADGLPEHHEEREEKAASNREHFHRLQTLARLYWAGQPRAGGISPRLAA